MDANAGAPGDQAEILEWFARQLAQQFRIKVERVTTHAAVIFLAGDRAFKIKRAVRYPYLDFSTADRRRDVLNRELTLNRRTAPCLYRRVFSINQGADGLLQPVGSSSGSAVEWVLEMVRFDRAQELDRLALRGALDADLIDKLAIAIAKFHKTCETRPDMGGASEMERLIHLNTSQLMALAPQLGVDRIADFGRVSEHSLVCTRDLLETRRRAGFVRRCHGDLHLGNIVAIDGVPTLFDCIEFDERFACIDAYYDFAFLLMDLLHCDLRSLANRLLNGYLDALPYADHRSSLAGLALLPLFLSIRAAIRAHVEARRAAEQDAGGHKVVSAYMQLAEETLKPREQSLVAIGGLSGSGKSTLARRLAPHMPGALGAILLRTDVLRKRMRGLALTARLADDTYTAVASRAVYDEMFAHARCALKAGQSVILDAVFAHQSERRAAGALAQALGLPFHGIWLDAPYSDLVTRLDQRKGDASDATKAVLDRQCRSETGVIDWTKIDTASGPEQILARACKLIGAA